MAKPKVILVGGGARSGKSAHALALARALGVRRTFVATARRYDDDLSARIDRHVRDRGPDFVTVEEPVELPARLAGLGSTDVALVDCLTLWVSNLLMDGADDAAVEARFEALCGVLAAPPCHVVLVTNEVGMGIHPETPLGRRFRDLVGRGHQRVAAVADEVHFAVMGLVLRLSPGPVTALAPAVAR
ncbi:bifunctional adenosylcobinamide kinase/adenosylcobinamide-phosphate guanylyltransferase [Anaeromyxobacter oryzisoli]|uniref:bifunctional adenosylcobinamide kinase/adenosylcobinamide-phosphate guanylyltransferase n=1 Tax=Anaeromyxobacter oryzisoli TaxID=2925408 RepID=UPI001F56AB82|nr:bifunctional adenosylcobinamide kinase/adenosylcobinamide-phosphate guanylyltransferase [Anaeromyxobacter sp. SG63]